MKKIGLMISLIFIIFGTGCYRMAIKPSTEHYKDLAQQLIANSKDEKIKKIAVVGFIDLNSKNSENSYLNDYIVEQLITFLGRSSNFVVLERKLFNKIIEEQKLTLTDLFNPDTVKTIGSLTGAEGLVTGTYIFKEDESGFYIEINARLIDTETGEIASTAQLQYNKNYGGDLAACIKDVISCKTIMEEDFKSDKKAEAIERDSYAYILEGIAKSIELNSISIEGIKLMAEKFRLEARIYEKIKDPKDAIKFSEMKIKIFKPDENNGLKGIEFLKYVNQHLKRFLKEELKN
jgi:curli biogenesis system outer membrane secretion channel CsgG